MPYTTLFRSPCHEHDSKANEVGELDPSAEDLPSDPVDSHTAIIGGQRDSLYWYWFRHIIPRLLIAQRIIADRSIWTQMVQISPSTACSHHGIRVSPYYPLCPILRPFVRNYGPIPRPQCP